MLTFLIVAKLTLSVVFVMAGLAKLADRSGSRKALVEFGVTEYLARPGGGFLPIAEVATAVALLPNASSWWGATGALILLLFFILGISINLARGRTPDCHCFGQLHSAPAGLVTLGRNAILASLAGFVVWQGKYNQGPNVVGWFGDLTAAHRVGLLGVLAGFTLVAAEGALLLHILRQQGRLQLRIDEVEVHLWTSGTISEANFRGVSEAGLPVGTRAPGFRLDGLRGETLTLGALLAANKPTLLLFTHPNCGPCESLMPDLARWQQEYIARVNIALVSEGTLEDNRVKSAAHGLTQVLLQKKREVAEAYEAFGTPAAVLVRQDGTIGSPLAQGADTIRSLVNQAAGGIPQIQVAARVPSSLSVRNENGRGHGAAAALPALRIGELPPSLEFQDINHKTIALSSFRGSNTLLLFWNPACGFCQQMLDELKEWETDRPVGAPKLLVVSTGTVEENRAMNLHSPVLLDHNTRAGSVFGAHGTPMAILLNAEGRIASEVATGARAVLALAGSNPRATVLTS